MMIYIPIAHTKLDQHAVHEINRRSNCGDNATGLR